MDSRLELQKIIKSWFELTPTEAQVALNRKSDLPFTKDLANALVGLRRSGQECS